MPTRRLVSLTCGVPPHPAGSHDVSEGRFLPPRRMTAPSLFALFQGTRSGCAEPAFGFGFFEGTFKAARGKTKLVAAFSR